MSGSARLAGVSAAVAGNRVPGTGYRKTLTSGLSYPVPGPRSPVPAARRGSREEE